MNNLISSLMKKIYYQCCKQDAKLLPLRLFLGLGWLRAGMEKLGDASWHSGVALEQFFAEQILSGSVAFPFYESLMVGLFQQNHQLLSWLIMAGEFYVGLALLFGILTRPALVAGLFMNFNFILAGAVNPSAFYIIIQTVLLPSNVGMVMGLEAILIEKKVPEKVAHAWVLSALRWQLWFFMVGSIVCGILAAVMMPFVEALHPVTSLDDPVMLLVILLGLQSILMLTLGIRLVVRMADLEISQTGLTSKTHEVDESALRVLSNLFAAR